MPLKICPSGHQLHKSSDCPTCPICEEEHKPSSGFLAEIAAPARRALASKNISTLLELAKFTENEIAALHGMGPNAMGRLKDALNKDGLTFSFR
ncbi:hypothetical protein EZ428_23730 [Pedobacter frigiditerrae]|uniref:RNA polymerase alpha subunit C-terminal domain-containing protein n=1 Tax=Pedobacter frigiditerrae TaxID=2530452 RepID=A0A4R0MIQ6_9SPHI|nr:hypothetical protein [Pedobacter frigiditerrae]TCC86479.1 hypothetical protein EZ428_23730 [Pedobacter frigiditerrae]